MSVLAWPPFDKPPFDRFDLHSRRELAMSVVRTVLEDLNGIEEDAMWSKYRVLYIPERNGRVCIDTRVPKGMPWNDGVAGHLTSFHLSYRIYRGEENGDLILKVREVRWKGSVGAITRRVRDAALEGLGIVSANLRTP